MSERYVEYEKTGKYHHVKVVSDDTQPESPREEWDNFGIMACVNHRKYNLGDKKHTFKDANEFLRGLAQEIDPTFEDTVEHWESGNGWQHCQNKHPGDWQEAANMADERINKRMWKILDKAVMLPNYLYDHSGITMRCEPFSSPWDSGQVGYIYATPAMIRKEYGCKSITKDIRDKVRKCLEGEVEAYDQYLTGDVWGIIVEDMYGNTVDACWGFYGYEYAKEEAQGWLETSDKRGRPKCEDSEFKRMKAHEADLRKSYRALLKSGGEPNPIALAGILERAAKVQKERMELRKTLLSDHFAEEE